MLDFQRTQQAFIRHIKDPDKHPAPEGLEDRRLQIYRELFFNNVKGFLANGFPVLQSLYSESDWNKLARKFFASHQAQSPYFVDISREFVEFLSNEYEPIEVDPPFMLELAHYEWVELAVSIQKETRLQKYWNSESVFNRVMLSELATLVSYQYPVHQIKPSFQPQEPGEPVFLAVYRNTNNKVKFSLLNNVSAHMLTLLQAQPLNLDALSQQMQQALPQLPAEQIYQGCQQTVQRLLGEQVLCLAD